MIEKPHLAYTVEMYNDATRWIVTKASGDGYLVELDSKDQHHKCGCMFFQYQPKDSKKQCRHIKLVIRQIMEQWDEDYGVL